MCKVISQGSAGTNKARLLPWVWKHRMGGRGDIGPTYRLCHSNGGQEPLVDSMLNSSAEHQRWAGLQWSQAALEEMAQAALSRQH